jgi:hypothetical protein
MTTALILKRANASCPSGQWPDDDYDVLEDGVVVGRIFKATASPAGKPWRWTLAYGQRDDRTPTHGYGADTEPQTLQNLSNRANNGNTRYRSPLEPFLLTRVKCPATELGGDVPFDYLSHAIAR